MRPHRLRLTAFGPFPGKVELDLDEVSGAGPFLLRGATGAGKTSLLDAVGYALFGKVPGARGLKQLRSDHAPDHVRTAVELWATVAGRAVHVVRTPDQRRPRSRGTGWTTDKATVSVRVARDLAALDADDCDARWTGVQEANGELADLVGMTHEQFVQVVLLPQGDFARFLRAKDDDRAAVLRALFETGRFGAVERHLRARRDETRAALADAGAAVDAAAARVAAHAGVEDVPEVDLTAWAQQLLAQAAVQVSDTAARAGDAARQVTTARDEHGAAVTRRRLLGELVAAERTRADLLGRADDVAEQARELGDADRAAEVVALHHSHREALARAGRSLGAAAVGLASLPGSVPVSGLVPADLLEVSPDEVSPDEVDVDAVVALVQVLERHVAEATVTNAGLAALGKDVERWQRLQTGLAVRRRERGDAEASLIELRDRADELPTRLQGQAEELEALQQQAADLDPALREVERWEGVLARTALLGRLVVAAADAERLDLTARESQRAAERLLDERRRARLDGMSVELAGALVDGAPCGVCGSTIHPAPASGAGPVLDAGAEEQSRRDAVRAAADALAAGAEVARVVARRDDCHTQLAADARPEVTVPASDGLDETTLVDLREAAVAVLDGAGTRRLAADRAAADASAVASGLERLRQEQSRLAAAVGAAAAGRDAAAAAVEALEQEAVEVATELREALGSDPATEPPAATWARRAQAGLVHLEAVVAAHDAVSGCVSALTDLARTRGAAAAAAVGAGWAGTVEAVAAARPRTWREDTRRAVAAHERDLHAATLRSEELSERLGRPGQDREPDLLVADLLVAELDVASDREAELTVQLETLELARSAAEETLVRARTVRDGLARATPQLVDAEGRTGPLRVRAVAARELADLCSGANDKGIPLSTYVLAAHLEQVVEAANQRLHGMSDGRYALVHVEEGEDRRRRAGLGLAVLDAWTGRQRPAGTLSGGETFLASLALALGLADVVTAEAGGARIDALFVDEGFGTLDPDSLDRAMDVLDQLQEHGRMVGVVSHVGELRQRLPRQVLVEHGRSGSTVRVLTG